jgi:hypothetical protein
MEFINLLRPKNTFSKKVRIGSNRDGGYVLTKGIIDNTKYVFTYGFGGDSNFEEDLYTRYNIPSFIYDHECITHHHKENGLNFFPEGLGFKDKCGDFLKHYNDQKINDYVLLKIDIEGDEFPYLSNANLSEFSSKVSGIVIELHYLNYDDRRNEFIKIFTEIEKDFVLCHNHTNDCGQFNYNGVDIPFFYELTFINKKFIEKEEDEVDYSLFPMKGLDYPNHDDNRPQFTLEFLNQFPKN